MMFGQNRDQMRQFFCAVWSKRQTGQELQPLERMIAAVIERHPEYHVLLSSPVSAVDKDYTPEQNETNPFLHMALHIALEEQLTIDRPAGIRTIHQSLCAVSSDVHGAEHRMLDVLGASLWQAQRDGQAPDENSYLAELKRLR